MTLQEWINDKFAGLAEILPERVKEDPASFLCGHAMGYKRAMLDLNMFLELYQEAEEEKV